MNGKPDNAAPPTPSFGEEFMHCWKELPNKGFFFCLLAAWLLLFQFVGNSTFGYVATGSLPGWLWNTYTKGQDDSEEHGLLILAVVPVLFWWKRKELMAVPKQIWAPGLALLGLALVLHLAGYIGQQQRLSVVGMFLGIYALMGMAWGRGWLRESFFPFFLFAFCVPVTSIAGAITFPMRVMVCKIVTVVSQVLGIDVIRDGTRLFDAHHAYQYEVAAPCSGIHSLVAILCIATIYGFLTYEQNWKRLILMASAFPLAILGNVVRMMLIIVAADLGGQARGDFVHGNGFFSIVPYVPAIGGVMLVGHWLRERS